MPERRRRSATAETVFAFDFGLRRIGVAVGSTLMETGRPLPAIVAPPGREPGESEMGRIAALLAEHGARRLVVGCPYNADGRTSHLTSRALAFAADLERRFPSATVHRVDERYSSIEAQERLRARRASGQRRRRVDAAAIDSAAALVILERWLAGEEEEVRER